MRVVGIETSSPQGGVSIWDAAQELVTREAGVSNKHGESLGPLLASCLAEVGWSVGTVERFGVCVGPGSFTGLRVGIGMVLGIVRATGASVAAVSAFESLVTGLSPEYDGEELLAVLDALRGEFFVQRFVARAGHWSPVGIAAIHSATAVAALASPDGAPPVRVVGEAARGVLGAGARVLCDAPQDRPRPAQIARAAFGLCAEDIAMRPCVPLYVREPSISVAPGGPALRPVSEPSP